MTRLALIMAFAMAASPAAAQDQVAQFYKGRTVTVIVGSSAGGGYDIYARLMARHIGKYIPGNPSVMVTNMPGAGSNAAVAHIYNVAPRDGTFIAAPQNNAIMDAVFDVALGNNRRLRHDATKLHPASVLPPPTTTSASGGRMPQSNRSSRRSPTNG